MKVIETIAEMRQARQKLTGSVGFVPTMGYLHEGHIALVKRAKEENQAVVVSIFVNPTQFGPKEDFKSYPRDTERDLAMLEPFTDIVFMPSDKEMYPENTIPGWRSRGLPTTWKGRSGPAISAAWPPSSTSCSISSSRPKSYFGQKDAQQVAVIKKMVDDLNMNRRSSCALPCARRTVWR